MSEHDRIITPATDPDRFTAEEAAMFAAGLCGWQTAYGMPGTEYCGQPSKPGASFGHCELHEAELLVDNFPDGTDRWRANPRWDTEPGYEERADRAATLYALAEVTA